MALPFFLPGSTGPEATLAHLLLIDDDASLIPGQVRQAFPAPMHRVEVADTGAEGLARVHTQAPDVILLDQGLPDNSGLEVFQQLRQIDARIPVIFVTMVKGADGAIEAMKLGAYDYLFKPLDLHELRRVVSEALDMAKRMREPAVVAETAPASDVDGAIIGSCPAMREVYKAIGRVANQDVTVLITGESGTGKELVARAIYQHSHRAKGRFWRSIARQFRKLCWKANCLGTRKAPSPGPIGAASESSSNAMAAPSFSTRSATCRWPCRPRCFACCKSRAFERVGGNETVRTDVRLIAATHHNLKHDSAEGRFRADLYYRLGVFAIHLPPLRERSDDLSILVLHYLRRFSRDLGREVHEIAPEALERLRRCSWPGNIRELQSVLKQALLQAHGTILLPAFLPTLPGEICEQDPESLTETEGTSLEAFVRQCLAAEPGDLYAEAHRQLDRILLTRILDDTDGNQHQAARRLGVARETLRRRLRELGLHINRQLSIDEVDDPA